jgi:outer membrane protein
MRSRVSALLCCLIAAAPGIAHGADAGMLVPPEASKDWTILIGVEGVVQPRWDGSDRYLIRPSPLFDIWSASSPPRFRAPRDGIGFALIDTPQFRAGPVGKLRFKRKASDDPALTGLRDVDWAVEVGGFAEYWLADWLRLHGEVRQGIGGHHGLVGEIAADFIARATPQLTLSAGPRVTLQSSAALNPYFGIDAAESVASGLPLYTPKSGLYAVGGGAQARYQWTPQWATHAYVEYDRLQSGAANSPLVVQRGTADQWMFGFGASYAFNIPALW